MLHLGEFAFVVGQKIYRHVPVNLLVQVTGPISETLFAGHHDDQVQVAVRTGIATSSGSRRE